jgi:hypothetical protein
MVAPARYHTIAAHVSTYQHIGPESSPTATGTGRANNNTGPSEVVSATDMPERDGCPLSAVRCHAMAVTRQPESIIY